MEFKAKTRTEQILTVMHILAWVAFVGFMINAAGILVSYGVSLVSPATAEALYKGMNLRELRQYNVWHYTLAVSFMIAISCMKAFASFLAIKTLSKVNLADPFKLEVAHLLERISYVLFGTWAIVMLSNAHTVWLMEKTGVLHGAWISGEFIFAVGLVFVVAQVFKRGVEIQAENDLTV